MIVSWRLEVWGVIVQILSFVVVTQVLELVKEDLLEIEAEMEGRSSKVLNSEMREKLELQLESRFRDKDPEQAKSSDYERRPLSIGPPPRADSSLSLLSLHPPKKMIKPPWLAFD